MEYSSLGNWVSAIPAVMAQYGRDGNRLLQQLGVSSTPTPGSERLAVELTAKAWRLAAEQCADPAIGIRAAQFVQPAHWHAMGMAALCGSNLREIIQLMARYSALISNSITITLHDEDQHLVMTTSPVRPGYPGAESLDYGIATGLQILRATFPKPLLLSKLELMRQAPADARPYEEFFGCEVTFGADTNRLYYAHSDVDLPLSLANPELSAHHEQYMANYVDTLQGSKLVSRVQKEILYRLADGEVCQDTVAAALNMSARHLQRKLKEEQTCFKSILEGLRKELAQTYIQKEQRPLSDVAYLLGFSDHSNFTRAFKRWYGCVPKEFCRQQH